jgi:hypothetical protein
MSSLWTFQYDPPASRCGEDIAQLWLARWLADCGQAGELRQRADAGNGHALDELAEWLAAHHRFDELRELISAKEGRASQLLASWRPRVGYLDVVRLFADLGDDDAKRQLANWLARRGQTGELRHAQGRGQARPAAASQLLIWL